MASEGDVMVVVEMLIGCGAGAAVAVDAGSVAMVVVVVAMVEERDDTRIQHRTPRLSARAPSTPDEVVIPGLVMY